MSGKKGGARPGAGRPPVGGVASNANLMVRMPDELKAELAAHLVDINALRVAAGEKPLSMSRWVRNSLTYAMTIQKATEEHRADLASQPAL